jgi:transporter family-2 protein
VLAGAGIAVQQAAVAHVTRITGEPVVAGAVNFLLGALVVTAVTAALADLPAGGWPTAPGEWIGGLLGASVTVLLARVVAVLGALRVVLAVVAGQSLGGLVIDLVAPVPGEAVRLGTVVGVALTIAAVAVSGRGAPASRGPAAAQPAGA